MGNLGFLFNIGKEKIVVFTKSKKFKGNIILGFENHFKKDKCEFLFLSKNLKLEKFLLFENVSFRYGKIKVNNLKMVDFKDFLFYVKPYDFKLLKTLFFFDEIPINLNEILIKKVLEIYEVF